jgi:hypothetical protein
VFGIPLGVYRLSLARWFCRRIFAALAAIQVTDLVAIRPLSTFGHALCTRPVHRLAMTAMLKSQRGLSDLSLLRAVSSGQPRLLPVVHAALGTGRPIVDAGKLMVIRIHIDC